MRRDDLMGAPRTRSLTGSPAASGRWAMVVPLILLLIAAVVGAAFLGGRQAAPPPPAPKPSPAAISVPAARQAAAAARTAAAAAAAAARDATLIPEPRLGPSGDARPARAAPQPKQEARPAG
jgi:hypothetical protein